MKTGSCLVSHDHLVIKAMIIITVIKVEYSKTKKLLGAYIIRLENQMLYHESLLSSSA